MRGLGTSHNVPISPVRAEEKVARISLHLIHFPADIFSSLQRTPGGETGARRSSHRIVVSVPAFDDESHHLSRVSGQGRGKGRKKFFTPYSLSRGYFLQPSEEHREAKPVLEVLHTGLLFPSQPSTTRAITCLASPVRAEEKVARSSSHLIHFPADIFSSLQRNTRRRNRCQRFFTSDFLSSRVTAEEKVARSSSHLIYFPADIFSSLQRNTGRRNRCQRFFTSDFLSPRVTAEEKVARSSSHLIYIPADIFSNLKRTPGGETGARGSSRRIVSRLGLRQRKRSQEVLHTLFIFPPMFSPAFRGRREAKPLQEVLHT